MTDGALSLAEQAGVSTQSWPEGWRGGAKIMYDIQ
jgi:hypothetical protein